jgi:V8-like Glu-specific endopeptidase
MRLLTLAAAATLVLTGTAMADESVMTNAHVKRAHHQDANASIAEIPVNSIPADTLGVHDTYVRNLRDSGYDTLKDRNANGNVSVY